MTKVEFILENFKEYNRITIPKEAYCLFPKYRQTFMIKSDNDSVVNEVTVMGKPMSEKPQFNANQMV